MYPARSAIRHVTTQRLNSDIEMTRVRLAACVLFLSLPLVACSGDEAGEGNEPIMDEEVLDGPTGTFQLDSTGAVDLRPDPDAAPMDSAMGGAPMPSDSTTD